VDEDLGMDNRAEGVANARRNACDFEGIEEIWHILLESQSASTARL
jgi:hypothetical protein